MKKLNIEFLYHSIVMLDNGSFLDSDVIVSTSDSFTGSWCGYKTNITISL
jgi:hypothetical protein